MEEIDASVEQTAPVWAVFGDLMAGLLGAFVIILVGCSACRWNSPARWKPKSPSREAEDSGAWRLKRRWPAARLRPRDALNGRIGISGSVLFALNSDQLQPEGRLLLKNLAAPLAAYLARPATRC